MAEEIVKYRAKSGFTDPIIIINVISLALLNQDVVAVIPPRWRPLSTAVVAILTIILQLIPRIADNPVRLNIAPGDSKPVDVKKLV